MMDGRNCDTRYTRLEALVGSCVYSVLLCLDKKHKVDMFRTIYENLEL